MNFNAMISRGLRAAKLDVTLYNEVEADASLNRQALMVVIFAAVLSLSLIHISEPTRPY